MSLFTWQIYTNTEQAWNVMLGACKFATKSIDIEQYIFSNDSIGEKFIQLMKEQARRNVKVRLLLDTAGSYALYRSEIPAQLRKAGVEVRFFNIISPWRIPNFLSWFFRDHRKLIIVDDVVGITGGVGVREQMRDWRDTTLRVEGEIVKEMSVSFTEMWEHAGERKLFSRIRKIRGYTKKANFLTNSPYFRKRFLYHVFVEELRSAEKYIYLTTPYLVPDHRLIRILRLAVTRGVDVKILVPSSMDVPIVETASHSFYDELLKSGVRIYEYQPNFLHAKTAVVDGDWSTVGSFNLDNLSFFYNYEANVVSTDMKCAEEIKNNFFHDLTQSKEVTYSQWKRRPFVQKIQEFFVILIRWFL